MSGLAVAEETTLTVVSPNDDDGDGTVEVQSAASGSASVVTVAADVGAAGESGTFAVDRDGNFSTTDDQGIDDERQTVTITDGDDGDDDSVADGVITSSFVVDGGSNPVTGGPVSIGVDDGETLTGGPAATVTLEVDNHGPAIERLTTRDAGEAEGLIIGGGTDDRSPVAQNGQIDQLVVEFNETVDDSSVMANAFAVSEGYQIDTIKTGTTADDERIRIELIESSTPDTDATPSLTVAPQGVIDEAGNPFSGVTEREAVDGAAPVMTSAQTADDDGDGQVEEVNVNLSESVAEESSTVDESTFESEPYPVEDAASSATGEQATVDIADTPTENTSVTPEAVTLADGKLSDGANELESPQTLDTVDDGAQPVIDDISATNPGGDTATVQVQSQEQLGDESDDLGVSVAGEETTALNRDDFTKVGSEPNTYEATTSLDSTGNYTATLDSARDAAGNNGADEQSDSVSVGPMDGGSTGPATGAESVSGPAGNELSQGTTAATDDPSSQVPMASLGGSESTATGSETGQDTGERSTRQSGGGGTESGEEPPAASEISAPTGGDTGSESESDQSASEYAIDTDVGSDGETADSDELDGLWQTIGPVLFATLFGIVLTLAAVATLAVVVYTRSE